jgi:GDP-L-fucose synthase
MVGSALVRRLSAESCTILTVDRATLDLTRQAETEQWIGAAKPDVVILAAAKVGGIAFNDSHPVDFLSANIAIALNVIRASYAAGVKKLLFLGSSCIYPKLPKLPNLLRISPYADHYGATVRIFQFRLIMIIAE